MLEEDNTLLSIRKQSALLKLNRSNVYYVRRSINSEDIKMMGIIDEVHTKSPCYGRRRIHHELLRQGIFIGERHLTRLMKKMGIEAIYPHPNTSKSEPNHSIYPYLLKGVIANNPDHIWATDITYIKIKGTFMYLSVIVDWYSRYIVSWDLGERMNEDFVLRVLNEALAHSIPQIHNSDQGSVYTANEYTDLLKFNNIQISMDHRGRCFDNIFTERLWRTIKYEEVYIKEYESPKDARISLKQYITYYNNERLHSSLSYRTPKEIYFNNNLY